MTVSQSNGCLTQTSVASTSLKSIVTAPLPSSSLPMPSQNEEYCGRSQWSYSTTVGSPSSASSSTMSAYSETVTFLAENTIFRVPRRRLESTPDSLFSGMFLLPSEAHEPEGSSDSNPIHLPATITAKDFAFFVEALCPESISMPSLDSNSDGWLSVLALATQWHFDDLRKKAIEVLSKQSRTAVDKLVLGRTYVVSNWLVSAYQDLVTSDAPLTPESEHALGEWAVSHLQEIKMERRQTERAGEKFDVCKKVKEAFEDELMDDEEYREAVKLEKSLKTKPLCWPWTMMRGIGV
ncbi:uncharacterized protein STEHIDRAFT_168003 [Stereum hirsutum FP-91666 SS1]|uniref:uncharacterized protein n=1 Tax=Stereum hirsutum (strain FP-91666) TaxID=721885 RepID=UPI000440E622|nr:uncharacterized protein STEHIDRAFT_168003 [Stereum hirsutum FP-91666 SS1]EIM87171.1 hypothetical protein STEHIDRAFT_168003 [Stereum hirsutum FP-91666 SS1]